MSDAYIAEKIARNFLKGRFASDHEFKKLSEKIQNTIGQLLKAEHSEELNNNWKAIVWAINNESNEIKRNKIIRDISEAFKDTIETIVEEKSFWKLDFEAFFEIIDRALNIIAVAFGHESHGLMVKGKIRVKAENEVNLESIKTNILKAFSKAITSFPETIIKQDENLMKVLQDSSDNQAKIDAVKAYITKTPNSLNTFLFHDIGSSRNVYLEALIPLIEQKNVDHHFRLSAIASGNLSLVAKAFEGYKEDDKQKRLELLSQASSLVDPAVAEYLLEKQIVNAEDIKSLKLVHLYSPLSAKNNDNADRIKWAMAKGWAPSITDNNDFKDAVTWVNNKTMSYDTLKLLLDNGLMSNNEPKESYANQLFLDSFEVGKFVINNYPELSAQKLRLNTIKLNYDNPSSNGKDGNSLLTLVNETIQNKEHDFLQKLFNCGLSSNLGKKLMLEINKPGFEKIKETVEKQQEIETKLKDYAEAFEEKIIGSKFASGSVRSKTKEQIYHYLVDMKCGRISEAAEEEIAEMLEHDPKTEANQFVEKFETKTIIHKDTTHLFFDLINNLSHLCSLGSINEGRVKSVSFVEKLAAESKNTENSKGK